MQNLLKKIRVHVTISLLTWNKNITFGPVTAKYVIVKGAVTILTLGINFSIKI